MTKKEPVNELIELTARLIARAHLRGCSAQTTEADEQPDSASSNEGNTSSNQADSKGENS